MTRWGGTTSDQYQREFFIPGEGYDVMWRLAIKTDIHPSHKKVDTTLRIYREDLYPT
jgi:hypothetical protein